MKFLKNILSIFLLMFIFSCNTERVEKLGQSLVKKVVQTNKWNKILNHKCALKTNHYELLKAEQKCTAWENNYQFIETSLLIGDEFFIMSKLLLSQSGYFWNESNDIQKQLIQFDFIKNNNVKFSNSDFYPVLISNFWSKKPDHFNVSISNKKYVRDSCFGFMDKSIDKRHNIYGIICNKKDKRIGIKKRKELLNHLYIDHNYVSTLPKILELNK